MWLVLEQKVVTHGRWRNFHRKNHRGHTEAPLDVKLRQMDGRVRVVLEGRADGQDLRVREDVMVAV